MFVGGKGKVSTFSKSLFSVFKTWLKHKIKIVNYFYSIFLILLHTLLNSSYAITQEKLIVLSSFLDFITTIYVIWKWLHNYPEEGTQLHILFRDETLFNLSLRAFPHFPISFLVSNESRELSTRSSRVQSVV